MDTSSTSSSATVMSASTATSAATSSLGSVFNFGENNQNNNPSGKRIAALARHGKNSSSTSAHNARLGAYAGILSEFISPALGVFDSRYQRNNKKGGVKNLRCFPKCMHFPGCKGHPCARSVVVRLKVPKEALEGVDHLEIRDHVVAFCRFRATDDTEMPENLLKFQIGETYPRMRATLTSRLRTKQHPLGDFFASVINLERTDWRFSSSDISTMASGSFSSGACPPGVTSAVASSGISSDPSSSADASSYVTLTVEFKERGWHYGWTGGRYKMGQEHIFEFFAFEHTGARDANKTDELRCLVAMSSAPFTVYSSRRSDPKDKLKRREQSRKKRVDQKGRCEFFLLFMSDVA